MHARDTFPSKCMPAFLSFVMGIARNIWRCRSLERKRTRQTVGQDTEGGKWHRCTEIIKATLGCTSPRPYLEMNNTFNTKRAKF